MAAETDPETPQLAATAADETTRLLPKAVNGDGSQNPTRKGQPQIVSDKLAPWKLILNEFWIIFRGSVPVILAYSLQNSLQTLSIVVVGRSSPEDLATAAFAYMFAMATAWLVALGGTTALDTIASSTFTGSKDPHDLGILLQRAWLVLGCMYIPIAVVWIFSEPLFLALGQDPQISRDSAHFLRCLIPGGLGYIAFEATKKFLQAQEIMRPGTYVLLITSPLNVGLNYLFVYTFGIGLLGAAIATGISYWLSFLLLLAYARFVQGWDCWGGFSKRAFQNLWTFTRLALLGICHVGSEWWAFEIIALVAGRLGTIPLAAQSVIMTSDQLINTIPFGIGVATSARVGNLLGARDAKGTARAAHAAAGLSMLLGVVVLAILMGTRNHFAKIFNDDEQVVRLTAEVLPAVALFQIADGLAQSCGGALRGMGKQIIGAAVNLVSYYCAALPLGIYLAFHGWGLQGLWWGNCIALYIAGVLQYILVSFSKWDREVSRAFRRMDRAEDMDDSAPAS